MMSVNDWRSSKVSVRRRRLSACVVSGLAFLFASCSSSNPVEPARRPLRRRNLRRNVHADDHCKRGCGPVCTHLSAGGQDGACIPPPSRSGSFRDAPRGGVSGRRRVRRQSRLLFRNRQREGREPFLDSRRVAGSMVALPSRGSCRRVVERWHAAGRRWGNQRHGLAAQFRGRAELSTTLAADNAPSRASKW